MSVGVRDPLDTNLLLGKGKLYFARLTGGVASGYDFLGNVTDVQYETEDETREKYSSAQASAPLLKKALIRRKPKVSWSMDEFTDRNLALAAMGVVASYSQANTPVVDEIVSTAPVKGRHYKVAKRGISSVVVKRGATTLTLTTDYLIHDAEAGIIFLNAVSAAFDGGSGNLTVSYTPSTVTAQDMVTPGTASVIEGALLFMGDPSVGPKWELELWKVSISPGGGLSLIGDDFGSMPITAEVLDDSTNHPTQPFGRAILRP